MLLEIEHHMCFSYDRFVRESHMELRIEPRSQAQQTLHEFSLAVGPPTRITRHEDWMGNTVHWFSITDYHKRIELLIRSVVEVHPANIFADINDPLPMEELHNREQMTLYDFTLFSGPIIDTPALRDFHKQLKLPECKTLGTLVTQLGNGLHSQLTYQQNVSNYASTTQDLLDTGAGVCQDFAHLALALFRLSGVPCRYVSGYLHIDQQSETPSQSHAWMEFFSPSKGWIAFDPTHNVFPNDCYATVAYGRNYNDVPPNKGIFQGNASETLEAHVVTRPAVRTESVQLRQETYLDLPVYQEIPESDRSKNQHSAGESAASQQQQQQ
ncbi:MAG: transglutaminase family protein [Phycisphaerales bacterium]|nr:transglutaminase family protein [Phycisphaerales bacterium]